MEKPRRQFMRATRLLSVALAALAIAMVGVVAHGSIVAQAEQQQQAAPKPPPPKAYKPVPIALPEPVKDPSFAAFRKQLLGIAERKDRNALAKLVAKTFFWIPQDKDVADKSKPPIENLSNAIGLDGADAEGWDILAVFADEPTADPDPERKGVICAPADPKYDAAAAEELGKATGTQSGSWYYPVTAGVEIRADASATSPVVGKLGMHLVWIYPDESPAAAVQADTVRIVLPSGKFGFVSVDALLPLPGDLICYVKEGTAWRIAGVIGGGP
jgi:hypothetical protein